jgi:O-antigen/teichoic acid export membrane protein
MDIGHHMLRGSAWMIGMRWLMRFIGLFSTIVLARILTPDDFGLVAMSAVVVELLMMLGDTNVDIALIREPGTPRKIYDSAWTVQALFGLGVAVLVVAAAAPLAAYYGDRRVELVMYILALRPAILGFENVGVAEFRKQLDFAKEFRYGVWRKLSLFAIGLGLALTLQNYLALAIAAPVSAAVAVFFSFAMSAYRPTFCLSHAWLVWSSSRWLILQNLSQAALERGDELIIGGVAAPATVGHYYMASQVAPLPTREVAWPLERALVPTYAKLITAGESIAPSVVNVMGLMAIFCCAAGVGLAVIAHDLVLLVFGAQWQASVPFFQWLAIFGLFAGLTRPLMPAFCVLKHERLYALLTTAQTFVTLPVLVFAAYSIDITAVAAGRAIVAAVFFVTFCVVACRIAHVRAGAFLNVMWRPVIASLVMASAVVASRDPALPGHLLPLIHDIAIGVAVFALTQLGLWVLSGRPWGPEQLVIDRFVAWGRSYRRPAQNPAE